MEINTKEKLVKVIGIDGYALEYASESLKNDKEIFLSAVKGSDML